MISNFLSEREIKELRELKQCLMKAIIILSSTFISVTLYKMLTITF